MLQQGIARGAWLITLAPGALFAGVLKTLLGGGAVGETRTATPPPRIQCATPATLRLRRFEDGSAQVLCAHRVIVRISVPG